MGRERRRDVDRDDSIEDRVERLNELAEEEAEARKRARVTARIMTLLIVIAALGGVYFLVQPGIAAYRNPEPYQTALQEEFQTSLQPAVEAMMQEEQTQQGLQQAGEAAMARVREREEDLASAVQSGLQTFMQEMQEWSQQELATRPEQVETAMRLALQEAHPELENEVAIANANEAMHNVLARVLTEHLQGHVDMIASIRERVDGFPVPPDIQQMSDDELSEALTEALGLYAMQMFGQTLAPETRQFLAGIEQAGAEAPKPEEPDLGIIPIPNIVTAVQPTPETTPALAIPASL